MNKLVSSRVETIINFHESFHCLCNKSLIILSLSSSRRRGSTQKQYHSLDPRLALWALEDDRPVEKNLSLIKTRSQLSLFKNFALLFLVSNLFVFSAHGASPDQTLTQLPVKRAIVVGATSGIGRQVAKELAFQGYQVGLVGRRTHLLASLSQEISSTTYQACIDVSNHEVAADQLKQLIAQMGGLDLMVVSVSSFNDVSNSVQEGRPQNWDADIKTINVEAAGFYTAAAVALDFFEQQKSGHLVGISSISGLRGDARCPVYCAAKAFVSCYLEGVRNKMIQNNVPIYVTDILPGWVDTEQKKFSELPETYWVIPAEQAARDIVDAIKNKEKVRYVAKRQKLIAWALALCPDVLYNWIGGF